MAWKFINEKCIEHREGYRIQLNAGSWSNPADIDPKFGKGVDALSMVRLIREGLCFASDNAKTVSKEDKRPTATVATKNTNKSERPVLSLKPRNTPDRAA